MAGAHSKPAKGPVSSGLSSLDIAMSPPPNRRQRLACAALALLLAVGAVPVRAQVRLPSLGESASDDLTVAVERRLGDQIMRDIRRDPDYLDDPVLLEYLQSIWNPLVSVARLRGDIAPDIGVAFAWEAFLVRDRSVNAFALPGGYVGVHLALIALTGSGDELASVIAHELSHVTQRHIARSITNSQRQGLLAMAGMILGILAASRSHSPDAAQAAVIGSQAASAQGQLNFSRDMEREADRIGFAVLDQAGFAPAGMALMFEKLDQANRLNDSGSYPYLRSHPLTTERVAEARTRASAAASGTQTRLEHQLMQSRSRALMDPSVQARRRLQELDLDGGTAAPGERLAALYASAMASMLLRDFARAERALASSQRTAAGLGAGLEPRAARALALLGAELALAQGDAQMAARRLAEPTPDGVSRPHLLLQAQIAVAGNDTDLLKRQTEALQAWVTERRGDVLAWWALAQCADRLGLKLRAVRAQAEAHAAQGDLNGAIERMRAGQRLARGGGAQDFIEASVIDARLRELEAQRRQLAAELRGNRPTNDPQ
jgi:predicted Zn-dependent protease